MEIQSLAQAGLTYGKDKFDLERYERLREISAEMMAYKTDLPIEKVKELFCGETGYQTPKVDTRAAVFKENKILLVRENNGKWSLPGGWCDFDQSVGANTVKETLEEAGADVKPEKLIAVQDRNLHNSPPYAYGVIKIFVLCSYIGGSFCKNIETTESRFFSKEELPDNFANEKTQKSRRSCALKRMKRKTGKQFLTDQQKTPSGALFPGGVAIIICLLFSKAL